MWKVEHWLSLKMEPLCFNIQNTCLQENGEREAMGAKLLRFREPLCFEKSFTPLSSVSHPLPWSEWVAFHQDMPISMMFSTFSCYRSSICKYFGYCHHHSRSFVEIILHLCSCACSSEAIIHSLVRTKASWMPQNRPSLHHYLIEGSGL